MQDPAITVRNCLYENWFQSGDYDRTNIKFSTGWYDEDEESPQITVIEAFTDDVPFELGYGVVRVLAIYQVDIWVRIKKFETGKGRGHAKKWKWALREKAKDILKANMTGLTDLRYVWLDQPGRSLDDLKGTPPLLRWMQQVSVIYDI